MPSAGAARRPPAPPGSAPDGARSPPERFVWHDPAPRVGRGASASPTGDGRVLRGPGRSAMSWARKLERAREDPRLAIAVGMALARGQYYRLLFRLRGQRVVIGSGFQVTGRLDI